MYEMFIMMLTGGGNQWIETNIALFNLNIIYYKILFEHLTKKTALQFLSTINTPSHFNSSPHIYLVICLFNVQIFLTECFYLHFVSVLLYLVPCQDVIFWDSRVSGSSC